MEFVVNEYCKTYQTKYQEHLVERHIARGNTDTEVFKSAYGFQRSLRYCNGYYIRFADETMEKKYRDWIANGGVTMSLYYGNGTVD